MSRLIKGRLVDGSTVAVHVENAHVTAVEPIVGLSPDHDLPFVAPGLVDIQVNGYGGFDLQHPELTPETVAKLVQRLWAEGVTAFCPTVCTHAPDHMLAIVQAIDRMCAEYPQEAQSIAGIHLEGPYISPEDGPRGAHPREHTRLPDYNEYQALQAASGGRVRIVTLAPELPGALELISRLAAAGVIVALGHTNATRADIQAAVAAGAQLSTHLGNGSHQMVPRHRNYIWEQLAEDRLMASLITDTHHLPQAVVTCMFRCKGPERVIIISDAAFPGGLTPGLYSNSYSSGVIELRPDGYLGVPGTGNLAGSASNIRQCVAGAAAMTQLPLSTILPMATEHPASLLGRSDLGRITPGARADMVLFRQAGSEMVVEETILAGQTVYRSQPA